MSKRYSFRQVIFNDDLSTCDYCKAGKEYFASGCDAAFTVPSNRTIDNAVTDGLTSTGMLYYCYREHELVKFTVAWIEIHIY